MITNIARLLQARKPNATADWMQRLPQMARRLEESLFRSATSFEEYRDTSTLKKRLQAMAIAIGLRPRQQQQAAGPAPAAPPPPPRPAGPAPAPAAAPAPQKPKKPLSGFLLFSREMRPKVRADDPGISFADMSKRLGELWRGLSDAEKASYSRK